MLILLSFLPAHLDHRPKRAETMNDKLYDIGRIGVYRVYRVYHRYNLYTLLHPYPRYPLLPFLPHPLDIIVLERSFYWLSWVIIERSF